MNYTDGYAHSLDYFSESFYKNVNVTESSFDSLKLRLYSNAGVKILPGMQKIKFNYYSPQNMLLSSDTVLVVKEGDHQPESLGVESILPEAMKGDYFVYTGSDTDNYKYGDLIQFNGSGWEPVPESSEKVAQSLSSALSSDDLDWSRVLNNEGVLSKMIEKLAVNEAFITKLASTMITLHQENGTGGIIKSSNYPADNIDENGNIIRPSTSGWAITHTGKADFTDVIVTGQLISSRGIVAEKKLIYNEATEDLNVFYDSLIEAFGTDVLSLTETFIVCGGYIEAVDFKSEHLTVTATGFINGIYVYNTELIENGRTRLFTEIRFMCNYVFTNMDEGWNTAGYIIIMQRSKYMDTGETEYVKSLYNKSEYLNPYTYKIKTNIIY